MAVVFMTALSSATLLAFMHLWWAVVPALLVLELLVFPLFWVAKYKRFNARGGAPHGQSPRDVFDRFTKQHAKLSKYVCIKVRWRQNLGKAHACMQHTQASAVNTCM